MTSRLTKSLLAALLAFAVATPALAVPPTTDAAVDETYAALLGVQAERLSAADMDAIHGALTGQELFDKLLASANLIKDPVLRQKVVDRLMASQTSLVAFFDRLLKLRR